LSKKATEDDLDQQIIHTVETAKPESVQQLIDQVQAMSSKPREEILGRILRLEQKGKIGFKPPQRPTQESFSRYLSSDRALWYWITIALTLATMLAVFVVPENDFPLGYVRYALGIIFILWLPGYVFIKMLFPQTLPFAHGLAHSLETTEKNVDIIERVALSLGMSIALVPIVSLLLNYTPWGIRLTPIVLSLTALTIVFATAAVAREHQIETKQGDYMAK
jgi:hypothetical protein